MPSVTHSYYEWQLATLLLAYDAAQPLARNDDAGLEARQRQVEQELYDLVQGLLPDEYKKNPEQDFPPSLVIAMTRATLRRAMQIASVE